MASSSTRTRVSSERDESEHTRERKRRGALDSELIDRKIHDPPRRAREGLISKYIGVPTVVPESARESTGKYQEMPEKDQHL